MFVGAELVGHKIPLDPPFPKGEEVFALHDSPFVKGGRGDLVRWGK